ncbi:head-tail adaptor protein [Thalassococcus profundi]|uniref:Head-tail adaptor protein n=1 Tax=Thalassococcus profundi TaxID=2282382 RepID=A0A369TP01_9RHOB|nr:head-tail adaptor protein [Thalassococcus profundi]RDD67003.1 head-tail adaptor protein [Thalassococcus profundi]
MKRPDLRHALVLEAPETSPDGAGGWTTSWTEMGTVWAALLPRSGRESTGEAGALATANYRIVVRGAQQGHGARPQPGQRFRLGVRLWAIQAVTEADAQGRYLTCYAQEEVAA